MSFFESFGLHPRLLDGLRDANYTEPTPLQHDILPLALQDLSIISKARSGMGKDGSFIVPAIQAICNQPPKARTQKQPSILILTSTPQRADKIDELIWVMGYHAQISSSKILFKGDKQQQKADLENGTQIIITNPRYFSGMCRDLDLSFPHLKMLIIDEMDFMLNGGEAKYLYTIAERIGHPCQVLAYAQRRARGMEKVFSFCTDSIHTIGFPALTIIPKEDKKQKEDSVEEAPKNESPQKGNEAASNKPVDTPQVKEEPKKHKGHPKQETAQKPMKQQPVAPPPMEMPTAPVIEDLEVETNITSYKKSPAKVTPPTSAVDEEKVFNTPAVAKEAKAQEKPQPKAKPQQQAKVAEEKPKAKKEVRPAADTEQPVEAELNVDPEKHHLIMTRWPQTPENIEKDPIILPSDTEFPKDAVQQFIRIPGRLKISTLMSLQEEQNVDRMIVYTASKRGSDRLYRVFKSKKLKVARINSRQNEEERKAFVDQFNNGELNFLLISEINPCYYGLNVDTMVNYDLPDSFNEYTLRVCACQGEGILRAVSLVSDIDVPALEILARFSPAPIVEQPLPEKAQKKLKDQKQNRSKNTKKSKPKKKKTQDKEGNEEKPKRPKTSSNKSKPRNTKNKSNRNRDNENPRARKKHNPTSHKRKRKSNEARTSLPQANFDKLDRSKEKHESKKGIVGFFKNLFS